MFCQVSYETLSFAWEAFREGDFLSKGHLEDFIGVSVHEWRPAHDQFVNEDAQCVPVRGASMAHVKDDLGCDVLRRATESISAVPRLQTLDEAEVCQLDEPSVLHQDILWLQIPVDQVLPVHVLKAEDDLGGVELHERGAHAAN